MALNDITLNDGKGTPVAHTYTYVSTENGKVIRRDMTQSPETPWQMAIGHSARKVQGINVDSHVIRFDISILDADGVTVHNANFRLVGEVPRPVASDALADDFAALVRNYASSANMRAILKGSVG